MKGFISEQTSPREQQWGPSINSKSLRSESDLLDSSQVLRIELQRSDIIKQKHQREIQQLLNYEKLVRQKREQNEYKLLNIFTKQKAVDDKKQQQQSLVPHVLFQFQVNWVLLQKDKKQLKKEKEIQEQMKINHNQYYSSSQQQIRLQKQVGKDRQIQNQLIQLRRSNKEEENNSFDYNNGIKPYNQSEQNLGGYYNPQNNQEDKQTRLSRNKTQDYKQMKQQMAYQQQQDLNMKIQQSNDSIDRGKIHDQQVRKVLNNNREITSQKSAYYAEKAKIVENKIKQIADSQRQSIILHKEVEMMKDQHRNFVKQNCEIMGQLKIDDISHFQQNKRIRNEQLKLHQSLMKKERFQLLDSLEEERRQMHKQMEIERYPLLNSKDYRDQFNENSIRKQ